MERIARSASTSVNSVYECKLDQWWLIAAGFNNNTHIRLSASCRIQTRNTPRIHATVQKTLARYLVSSLCFNSFLFTLQGLLPGRHSSVSFYLCGLSKRVAPILCKLSGWFLIQWIIWHLLVGDEPWPKGINSDWLLTNMTVWWAVWQAHGAVLHTFSVLRVWVVTWAAETWSWLIRFEQTGTTILQRTRSGACVHNFWF